MDRQCLLCGRAAIALDPPHRAQAMISDGRIHPAPLNKLSCLSCGATCRSTAPTEASVRAIYHDDYALPDLAPAADTARAQYYAAWLAPHLGTPARVLDVGCGSGALLHQLAERWPQAHLCGVDPSAPAISSRPNLTLHRGFLDAVAPSERFDVIVAVNVIEHSYDPARFLQDLAQRLSPGGRLAIVCPAADPANVELLFEDHLWTLTPRALARAADASGLGVIGDERAPPQIGDFQLIVLAPGSDTPLPAAAVSAEQLARSRETYLRRWRALDDDLAARLPRGEPLFGFGAGQMAALLRCYAPNSWARIKSLLVDDPMDAWPLGKPVLSYRTERPSGGPVLLAVAARSQALVHGRLADDGLQPIGWDDLIAR
jgi:SAM-dependent methyltransferase